jgi:hypothetical protein
MRIADKIALFGLLIAVSSAANPTQRSVAYWHGTLECLAGNDGPGQRLVLTEAKTCEGRSCYPRLEIDVKVQPIPAHRRIVIGIGSENGAFRCPEPKEGCQQFLSGELVFDHFEAKPRSNKGISTRDGHYVLRSKSGNARGHFKVDGDGFCG